MKKYIIIGILFAILGIVCFGYINAYNKEKKERERQQNNVSSLMTEVERYKIADSLNVAEANTLRLTLSEFKKYRSEDAELIKKLKTKNLDLDRYVKIQAVTIDSIQGSVSDSIVYRDNYIDTLKNISVNTKYFTLNGYIDKHSFKGSYKYVQELRVVARIKHKRFLGFLWKTGKIQEYKVDVLSMDKNCIIGNVEAIMIE